MKQFQSLGEVLSALLRHVWLIGAIIIAGCIASVLYALNQPKLYATTAVIQKEEASVPDDNSELDGNTPMQRALEVRLIEQRLMARDMLLSVMEQFDLFDSTSDVSLNQRVFQMREAISVSGIINEAQAYLPGASQPSGIRITVRYHDPEIAAGIANEMMQRVIDMSSSLAQRRAQESYEFYSAELERLDSEVATLRQRIASYKSENSQALPEIIVDLRSELSSLRRTNLDIEGGLRTIEGAERPMRAEVKARELAILREQKALVEARMAQIRAELSRVPEVEGDLAMLERGFEELRVQYDMVAYRKAQADIDRMLESGRQAERFAVLETALIPEVPVSRSRRKTAMMGGVASVMAAIAAALALEMLNPKIRSPGQMERMLGIRPVISIPVIEGHGGAPRGSRLRQVLTAGLRRRRARG